MAESDVQGDPGMKTILAGAALVAAVALAAPAHADSDDYAFLNALHRHGITEKEALIRYAQGVCGLLDHGYTVDGLVAQTNGVRDADMKYLIKTAEASYCPQL
jgi:hypothetical protein